ncbi:MAG TPA: restriction endonuclease subunit S [Bacteroidales bacterium]
MQVKLSQILSSLESGGRPKGGASLDNNGIPSLGAEHLDGNGGFNFKTIKYIPDDFFNGLKNGIVEKENILIVKDGATTGKVSFVTDEFPFDKAAVNEHVFLLKVDKSKANPKFVFHYLKCPQGQREIMRDFRGATVGGISRGFVDFVKFELPSLPDQLHIANLLSKAENLIAQRKESIRLLDEFLKSTFLEMFGDPVRNEKGWDKVVLGNVCKKIGSGSTPRGGKESYHKEGISLIRSLNVHNDEFVYKDLAFIDDKQAHELRNVIVEENDVLLNITGASVARCCIVPKEILPARVNQHVSILRPDNEVLNPYFLSRMFTTKTYQLKLVKDAKSKGATREAITKEELEQMKVIAPPLSLQTQFAHIVEKTEALKTQYQQSLQELENLYGSLSQKAFRGELIKK